MRKFVLGIFIVTVAAGCSRLNPMNLVRGDRAADASATVVPPIIPPNKVQAPKTEGRALIGKLVSLDIQNVAGGVLVKAVGRTDRVGAFNLQLVNDGLDGATLNLSFRVEYPARQTAASSNLVTVAQFLSEKDLRGARSIRVVGADRSLSRSN